MASSSSSDVYQANDLRDFIANLSQEILDEVVKDIPLPGEVPETTFNLNTNLPPLQQKRPQLLRTRSMPPLLHPSRPSPYGERPYGCTKCGKKYISKWALTRHCKVKHSPPAALQHQPGPHGFEESEPSNQ
ncbi:hypothetical protein AAVH_29262 [Aphelenchoides avenae]|nr:hypothetical protein AAVH_29262 [Aphelenchus avenae]